MRNILTILVAIFFFSCHTVGKRDLLVQLNSDQLEYDKADTLSSDLLRGIFYIRLTNYRPFGKYKYRYIISKNAHGISVIYKLPSDNDTWQISKEFISLDTAYGTVNWGWFKMHQKKIIEGLPNIASFIDSLKPFYPNDTYYYKMNGVVYLKLNGETFRKFHYGSFVTKANTEYFDSLKYGLYQLSGNKFNKVSSNGNDLFNQANGIYFVPLPGYGIIYKYDRNEIFLTIDSVTKLKEMPKNIYFKPVE